GNGNAMKPTASADDGGSGTRRCFARLPARNQRFHRRVQCIRHQSTGGAKCLQLASALDELRTFEEGVIHDPFNLRGVAPEDTVELPRQDVVAYHNDSSFDLL